MIQGNEGNVVKVGIAEMDIVKSPNTIRTSGLGSCVGVVLYDELKKIAGLVHIMLPDSSINRTATLNVAKFANTGIEALIRLLEQNGAQKSRLKAKIAGGAQMFSLTTKRDTMRIGPRNVEAVKQCLKKEGIPLISEDVGGNNGRTIEFNPDTKMLSIRTVNKGVSEI